MTIPSVINVDLADVFAQPGRKYFLHTLAWGDAVEVFYRSHALRGNASGDAPRRVTPNITLDSGRRAS